MYLGGFINKRVMPRAPPEGRVKRRQLKSRQASSADMYSVLLPWLYVILACHEEIDSRGRAPPCYLISLSCSVMVRKKAMTRPTVERQQGTPGHLVSVSMENNSEEAADSI